MVPLQFLALLHIARRGMLCAQSKHRCTHTNKCKCVSHRSCMHIHITEACRHATYVHVHTVTSVRPVPACQCRIDASGTCTDRMTSCRACYFARDERPLPSQCSTALERYRCADLTGRKRNQCLKRWGTCVKKAFKDIHGKVWYSSLVVWNRMLYIRVINIAAQQSSPRGVFFVICSLV